MTIAKLHAAPNAGNERFTVILSSSISARPRRADQSILLAAVAPLDRPGRFDI
jgi:hypothetical protein